MKRTLLIALLVLGTNPLYADTQREVIRGFAEALPADTAAAPTGIDRLSASFANPEAAANFVSHVVNRTDFEYCIIHLLRWAQPKDSNQDIQAQNWYVFRRTAKGWSQEDFTSRKHLAGTKTVYLAFVHLNIQHAYEPQYTIDVSKKLPSNLAHLLALLNAYAGGGSSSTSARALAVATDQWGGSLITLKYVPSTIKVAATQGTTNVALQTALGDSTFDNEGPLYWDISVAVPVRKISNVQFDTATGTPTPLKVSDQNVFGVLDGYLPGLDPSRSLFRMIPHPLAGVAFAQQPLHKILVGGGWGPSFAELYMGAMWVKQPVDAGGCGHVPATGAPTNNQYCAQFTIGINIQVSSVASAIKLH